MRQYVSREDYVEMLQNKRSIHHRERMMTELKKLPVFSQEELMDYIDEAEHQDGYAYWLQFKDAQQLFDDIQEYYSN